ncbi:MAG: AAA family ATPase, partial [Desulfovibrio sp.]|nr:AAA family ATPase [Desulfovibrio sp.]
MKELPTGVQGFAMLRREDMLYVDKTARLLEMIRMGRRIFLSRPRRFGKSLTVSTLEAMFGGRAEL